MNRNEAMARWAAEAPRLEEFGAIFPMVTSYIPSAWKANFQMAMDAAPVQPALTTDPNSAVPAMLTTMIDPDVFEILFSPNMAATIYGEQKKGTWLDETIMFPVVEHVGEVSSYGDYSNNGSTNANTNWPQRQSYLFQTIKQYGQRELERAGLGKISWVSEIDKAAATVLNKYSNFTYFFGVAGLQNYGALNDPHLSASLSPATKAAGGVKWVTNGVVTATANEIYADLQSIFFQLVAQTGGLVDAKSEFVIAMAPGSAIALTATNSFGVNVQDLLKKNFPNVRIETAVQYGELSDSNPQGVAAGNEVQMYVPQIEGQKTGFAAFNEKMRAFPIIRDLSSFKQKITGGTWGTVFRMPVAVASMVGV
jgi:hypothetical protein